MGKNCIFLIVLLWLVAAPADAGWVGLAGSGLGNLSVKVTSLKEARFSTTVRQQYDFSCGSAAVATLLTYHYNHPVTEQSVFKAMYEKGDKKKIRREGFSMLDMKNYLESIGFHAEGYQASLDKLAQAAIPAIALIKDNGYNHFVLIKGIRHDRVLVGDPAVGMRIIPRSEFEKMWTNGILFAINNVRDKGNFNRVREWHVRAAAPLDSVVHRDTLENITLLRRGPNDF